MGGIPINYQFILIEVCQLSKWPGEPIFNEKYSIPQGNDIGHRHNEKESAR